MIHDDMYYRIYVHCTMYIDCTYKAVNRGSLVKIFLPKIIMYSVFIKTRAARGWGQMTFALPSLKLPLVGENNYLTITEIPMFHDCLKSFLNAFIKVYITVIS